MPAKRSTCAGVGPRWGPCCFSWRILAVARQVAVSLHGRSMGQSRLQCRPGRVSPVSGHLRARSHREHPGGAIGRRPRLADLATEPAHHSCGPLGGRASGRELALAWKTRNPATATLAGVVAISGIYDLTPLVPTTLNDRLRLDLSQARQCSPIFRASGICPAAFLVGARKPRRSCGKAGKWRNAGPVMAIPPLIRRFTDRITSACSRP